MLAGIFPVYVDRFACDWHRLSTTDTHRYVIIALILFYFKAARYC